MVNVSLPHNDPLLNLSHASSYSKVLLNNDCFFSIESSIIIAVLLFTKMFLLLPLCIIILHHSFHKWRQNSSATSMSHCDCFTYHIVTMEIIGVFGFIVCCLGAYVNNFSLLMVGNSVYFFTWYGEEFFHILTCLERYLAVVHPLTYLTLRNKKWIRIRNISIGCMWLLCIVCGGLVQVNDIIIADLCLLSLVLACISFCSFSVLCALIRPGPGEQGENRKRVDQSKQRAFFTIICILGALVLRFASNLIWELVCISSRSFPCAISQSILLFNIPSTLVLPLLFLQREGILMFNNKKIMVG